MINALVKKIKSIFAPKITPTVEQPLDSTNFSPESWPFPTGRPEEGEPKAPPVAPPVAEKPRKKPIKSSYKKPAKIASKK